MNATSSKPTLKLKGLPALALLAVLIFGFGWWFFPGQANVPPQAQVRIKEALLKHYQELLTIQAYQNQTDALEKARQLKSLDEKRQAKTDTVEITIIKAWHNTTRNKLAVTVEPTFNAGPPPDGITRRTINLTPKGIDDWEAPVVLGVGTNSLAQ